MLMMLALWGPSPEGGSQLMLMPSPQGGSQLMLMRLALWGPVSSRSVAADARDARFGARLLKEGRS